MSKYRNDLCSFFEKILQSSIDFTHTGPFRYDKRIFFLGFEDPDTLTLLPFSLSAIVFTVYGISVFILLPPLNPKFKMQDKGKGLQKESHGHS